MRSPRRRPPAARRGTRARAAQTSARRPASIRTARPRLLLAGDIGGTKTNIALFEARARRVRLVEAERYVSHEHAGLAEIVAAFLATRRAAIAGAAFGVAGPVTDGRSRTTNLPWVVDARALSRRLRIPVALANDLAATASSLPELDPHQLATLQEGVRVRDGTLALVAAGTGLGEAYVLRPGGRFLVGASEGGHADYSPRTDEEIELLRFLRARFGRVSIERVLSGPGLVAIDEFLALREPVTPAGAGEPGSPDRAAAISQAALEGRSPRAAQALRLFASAYGAEAGNLALKVFATGGVYLAGGIAPKILPVLRDGTFLAAFLDKGRFRGPLASIPVRVILDDRAALIGAARIARELASV